LKELVKKLQGEIDDVSTENISLKKKAADD